MGQAWKKQSKNTLQPQNHRFCTVIFWKGDILELKNPEAICTSFTIQTGHPQGGIVHGFSKIAVSNSAKFPRPGHSTPSATAQARGALTPSFEPIPGPQIRTGIGRRCPLSWRWRAQCRKRSWAKPKRRSAVPSTAVCRQVSHSSRQIWPMTNCNIGATYLLQVGTRQKHELLWWAVWRTGFENIAWNDKMSIKPWNQRGNLFQRGSPCQKMHGMAWKLVNTLMTEYCPTWCVAVQNKKLSTSSRLAHSIILLGTDLFWSMTNMKIKTNNIISKD